MYSIVTYFGSIDHCSCIGLCIVTASSSTRLVTSDQLQKHKDLQINTRHIVYRRCFKKTNMGKLTQISDIQKPPIFTLWRKLVLFWRKHYTTKQRICNDLISNTISLKWLRPCITLTVRKTRFCHFWKPWAVTQTLAPSVNYLSGPAPKHYYALNVLQSAQ